MASGYLVASDPIETLAAAEILVKEGFVVLPYINADPVLAKRLQDVGTATMMPLGSPIGSNRGIETRAQIEIIKVLIQLNGRLNRLKNDGVAEVLIDPETHQSRDRARRANLSFL